MPDDRSQPTNPDFHFELRFMNDDQVEGTLDLDEHQIWGRPDVQQIIISLSGAQLLQLADWPSARARTKT